MPKVVREHEILRLLATVHGLEKPRAAETIRREILVWAQNRSGGRLPEEAWAFGGFDYFSGGRNSTAIRIKSNNIDVWSIRADDPDKNIPGRIWTTEAVVSLTGEAGSFRSLSLQFQRVHRTPTAPCLMRRASPAPLLALDMLSFCQLPTPGRSPIDSEDSVQTLAVPCEPISRVFPKIQIPTDTGLYWLITFRRPKARCNVRSG
jgi:hypothetical protein